MTDVLTAADLAELLRVHPNTVRNLTAREGLPYLRVGRLLRYRREAVESWLTLREQRVVARLVGGSGSVSAEARAASERLDRQLALAKAGGARDVPATTKKSRSR